MVYVQDINGKPMMPTTRHGKVRRLLKDKKAVVVNLCPFTIRLTYVTSDYKQEIVLGVDAGTKHVGLSATTKSKELYSSEVILRNDIVDLLSTRRELRKTRRNRLRYRKPRFNTLRDAAVMGIMKWKLYEELRSRYDRVSMTFGYITKHNRIKYGIEKSHTSDAFVISMNINAKRIERQYLKRLIRRHNRQIHKMKILKGGKKKNNQAPFEVFGFRLFDKVLYNNKILFVYGRRKSGSFNIRDFNGENSKDVSRKKFKLIRGKRHPIILK